MYNILYEYFSLKMTFLLSICTVSHITVWNISTRYTSFGDISFRAKKSSCDVKMMWVSKQNGYMVLFKLRRISFFRNWTFHIISFVHTSIKINLTRTQLKASPPHFVRLVTAFYRLTLLDVYLSTVFTVRIYQSCIFNDISFPKG